MKLGLSLAATAALLVASAGAAHAETVVTDTSLGVLPGAVTSTGPNGTTSTKAGARVSEAPAAGDWQQANVGGGATVGITKTYGDGPNGGAGNGSAYFASVDGTSKADMQYYLAAPVALSAFAGGSYDWYRDVASSNDPLQTASYRLLLTNGAVFTNLIYEPVYQTNPQVLAVPEGLWQTQTITTSSNFWSSNANLALPGGLGCHSCAQGASFSSWAAANSGFSIYGFSTGVGSGWNGPFQGAVDNFSFTLNGQTESFNFEVSAVPEPATWAMMIIGFGAVGTMVRSRRRMAIAA
nr:PEPxxWA-CTERM sorting domain-containing protein [Phenylobacterium sp.]